METSSSEKHVQLRHILDTLEDVVEELMKNGLEDTAYTVEQAREEILGEIHLIKGDDK